MTGSSTQGFRTVLHPVSDLVKAKRIDKTYYVGFEAQGRHIGLLPGGGPPGLTSSPAYWRVPDIEARPAELTATGATGAIGATVKEPAHDVGGGRLLTTVTDPDGTVLGLPQVR
ncbi:VOC family protein [Streptomyces sporangiiformans]|uniref:Glyoxalase n=1 Tax=Streptomyces sporangiiformans TaxID=2315329 RepID=A0A505D248_9ACTN|nr:glyoxalase [Streptomyces sporangiiformans]TPQ17764.1 glyoxalase [Streptomyces sporangiiformans]